MPGRVAGAIMILSSTFDPRGVVSTQCQRSVTCVYDMYMRCGSGRCDMEIKACLCAACCGRSSLCKEGLAHQQPGSASGSAQRSYCTVHTSSCRHAHTNARHLRRRRRRRRGWWWWWCRRSKRLTWEPAESPEECQVQGETKLESGDGSRR